MFEEVATHNEAVDSARTRFLHAVADVHSSLAALQAAVLDELPGRGEEIKTVRVSEAARMVRVSRQTIHRLVKSGKLELFKPSGGVGRVRVDDLMRMFGGKSREKTGDD